MAAAMVAAVGLQGPEWRISPRVIFCSRAANSILPGILPGISPGLNRAIPGEIRGLAGQGVCRRRAPSLSFIA